MQEQNSIFRIVRAVYDGQLSIDAAVADATRAILDEPLLREEVVKQMFAQIMDREMGMG